MRRRRESDEESGVVGGRTKARFWGRGREFVQTRNQMRRNEPSQLGDCDTPVTLGCPPLTPSPSDPFAGPAPSQLQAEIDASPSAFHRCLPNTSSRQHVFLPRPSTSATDDQGETPWASPVDGNVMRR